MTQATIPILIAMCLAFALTACDDMPKDPEQTLERVKSGTVRVGISSNPPFTTADEDKPGGVEVALIQPFFDSLDTKVHWEIGGETKLFGKLEKFELDLVLGGITEDSPWSKKLGLTKPYFEREEDGKKKRYVLAAPPGENAWIHALEKYLLANKERTAQLIEEAESTR